MMRRRWPVRQIASEVWQAAYLRAAKAFDESKIVRNDDGEFAPKGTAKGGNKAKAKPSTTGKKGTEKDRPVHDVKWSEIIETPSARLSKSYPKESRPDLSENESEAVRRYSLAAHRELNDALWDGKEIPQSHADIDKGLRSAFSKVKMFSEPVTVRRGKNLGPEQIKELASAKAGDEVIFPAYTSTTTKAGTFRGNVEFKIAAIKGLDIGSSGGDSVTAKEKELLLDKGSRFTVLSVKKTGRKYKIELAQMREEITASANKKTIKVDTRGEIEFEEISASWSHAYLQAARKFDESKVVRDEDGEFAPKGSAKGGKKAKPAAKSKPSPETAAAKPEIEKATANLKSLMTAKTPREEFAKAVSDTFSQISLDDAKAMAKQLGVYTSLSTKSAIQKKLLSNHDDRHGAAERGQAIEKAMKTDPQYKNPEPQLEQEKPQEKPSQAEKPAGSSPAEKSKLKSWIGSSKVTTPDGEPLPVYHGSKTEFKEFSEGNANDKSAFGPGLYFTTSPDEASKYAKGDGGQVYKTFLKIEKPFDMDKPLSAAEFESITRELGPSVNVSSDMKADDIYRVAEKMMSRKEINEKIKRAGFDGITRKSGVLMGTPHQVWMAFSRDQVKSATGNSGEYDAKNPRIDASWSDRYLSALGK
jgi:hypothetical protein